MENQSYGFCKYCGEQIIWTRMTSGKTMPCDPMAIKFKPGGPEVFVTPEGRVLRGRKDKNGQLGYISHFATCKNADAARRKLR